ncbi:ornithine cyclodeaminase family protein [Saccharopolyspora sp. MS10]|uniref:ornithine cyclodeaminase family protein n=1 Tax=Saccharopolyspora sp. MS10 TaxID=3385973 RepID=UPI0039A05682
MIWTDADVTAALDLDAAIRSQRMAFEALASGRARLAPKVSAPSGTGTALGYLGTLSAEHGAVSKLVAAHPGNAELGLPAISATVLVLDPRDGSLRAVLEGTALTELRTAAGSAVAIDALAPGSAAELAVLGTGVQARAHVRAIARVRALRAVRIHGRNPRRARALAAELAAELDLDVRPAGTAERALRGAELVAACTLSAEPVVHAELLEPGATVVTVGSYEPHRREVDDELVRRADLLVVDDVDTAAGHAGPLVRAIERGERERGQLRALGEVLLGRAPGRTRAEQLVLYTSVGIGVQDAAAAHAVLGTL